MSGRDQFGQDNPLILGANKVAHFDPEDASDDAGMFETVKQHIFGGMDESAYEGTDRYQATVLSVSKYASSSTGTQAVTAKLLAGLNIGIRPRFIVRARVDTLHSHLPDPCQYINQDRSSGTSTKRGVSTLLHPIFVAEANSGIIPNDGTNAAGTALPRPNAGDKIWVRFEKGPSAGVMRGGYYIGLIRKSTPGTRQSNKNCDLTALASIDGATVTNPVFAYNNAEAPECQPALGGAQCSVTPGAIASTADMQAFITELAEHAKTKGFAAPVVGSTYRNVADQARIVAGNWKRHGWDKGHAEGAQTYIVNLYGAEVGAAYHTAFLNNHVDGVVNQTGMDAAAANPLVKESSSHLTNPSTAVDLRMNSTLDSLFQSFLSVLPAQSVNGKVSAKWKGKTVSILSEADHRHVTVA